MKHIVIAPFEEDINTILAGIKEFPTEKVILLTPNEYLGHVKKAEKEFARFGIPLETVAIENDKSFEEIFEKIAHIKAKEKGKDIIMNLSSAGGTLNCISLSAAFVNGLKAFEIINEKLVVFPILKFSYYNMLSEKKLQILSLLGHKECCESLEELSRKVKLGPSLINYHIYGTEKNPGLNALGLVEIQRNKGKVSLKLTTLGRLLLKDKQFETVANSSKEPVKEPSRLVKRALAKEIPIVR
ncbi:hypothetical protein KKE06_02080 [Candidatus Micrarchaeota archaeon]|nr:hypothetical protein [Candidatus Micrarchaeota archaeon]MBU1929981.1 hypothetical protein [Candidatus Micrarchaeota archaeon]